MALDVTLDKSSRAPCPFCELVFTMCDVLKRIGNCIDVLAQIEPVYEVVGEILVVYKQKPSVELKATVEDLRKLRDGLTSSPGQEICKLESRSFAARPCTWERTVWTLSVRAGSKRGMRDTERFQEFVNEYCGLSVPELGSSKRIKWPVKCGLQNPEVQISTDQLVARKTSFVSSVLEKLRTFLPRQCSIPWFSKVGREVQISAPVTSWASLPNELHENILQRLEFRGLFRFKTFSKSCKEKVESDAFRQWRGAVSSESEGLFTAINFYIKDKQWRCSGFDLRSRMWKPLPSLSPALPTPDPELFKEYSVCGHGGLICADIAKLPQKGQLVVLNPLTQKKRELPPLLYPRSPVLVHMWVDPVSGSFIVTVAGSSASSDEKLSRKVEVFDSETSVWEETPELPGPNFGLNEHQVGVCVNGVLYFISFLDSGDGGRSGGSRGVVAFDVKTRKWLSNKACPIPFSTYSNTLQLVETKGELYLFSEQESAGSVDHCIDVLETVEGKFKLRNLVKVKKSGGRGLQVYPEYTCVSFGDEKLCIFNTLTRGGVVYDMRDGNEVQPLDPPPSDQKGENFFSLNPTSFVLQPSFKSDPE